MRISEHVEEESEADSRPTTHTGSDEHVLFGIFALYKAHASDGQLRLVMKI